MLGFWLFLSHILRFAYSPVWTGWLDSYWMSRRWIIWDFEVWPNLEESDHGLFWQTTDKAVGYYDKIKLCFACLSSLVTKRSRIWRNSNWKEIWENNYNFEIHESLWSLCCLNQIWPCTYARFIWCFRYNKANNII